MPLVILASSSPRRRDYLARLGVDFTAQAADVDETPLPDEEPVALAMRLAEMKARKVAEGLSPTRRSVVVGADTVVALEGRLLGKPADDAEAVTMLRQLRDRAHQVHSAVCLVETGGAVRSAVSTTTVWMRAYSDAEIDAYVATGDPLDKAGAYAIQHPDFRPVARIEGCLSGVVGLPLGELRDLLAQTGVEIADVAAVCEAQNRFICCRRTRRTAEIAAEAS